MRVGARAFARLGWRVGGGAWTVGGRWGMGRGGALPERPAGSSWGGGGGAWASGPLDPAALLGVGGARLGLDAGEEGLGGLVVGVLGDELAAEGFGEDGLVEVY